MRASWRIAAMGNAAGKVGRPTLIEAERDGI